MSATNAIDLRNPPADGYDLRAGADYGRVAATADGFTLDGAPLPSGDLTVQCHCADYGCGALRFDLRVGGATYLGAMIHGNGGVLNGAEDRFPAWLELARLEGRRLMVWTRDCPPNDCDLRFHVAASAVEVLRVWKLPKRAGR